MFRWLERRVEGTGRYLVRHKRGLAIVAGVVLAYQTVKLIRKAKEYGEDNDLLTAVKDIAQDVKQSVKDVLKK